LKGNGEKLMSLGMPHYPQVNWVSKENGEGLLEHFSDPYKAILSYRATHLPWSGLSLAEMLTGRKISTDIPEVNENLIPRWPYISSFKQADQKAKIVQRENYNWRHQVRELPQLSEDQTVWVKTRGLQTPGRVVQAANTSTSYVVEKPTDQVNRNLWSSQKSP